MAMQLSTVDLNAWSVEATYTLRVLPSDDTDGEDDLLPADDEANYDLGDEVVHAAEFNIVSDCSSLAEIAEHVHSNAAAYFDALNTGIEYESILSCFVTNINMHMDPTFLLMRSPQ